jgi:hypothetical protein
MLLISNIKICQPILVYISTSLSTTPIDIEYNPYSIALGVRFIIMLRNPNIWSFQKKVHRMKCKLKKTSLTWKYTTLRWQNTKPPGDNNSKFKRSNKGHNQEEILKSIHVYHKEDSQRSWKYPIQAEKNSDKPIPRLDHIRGKLVLFWPTAANNFIQNTFTTREAKCTILLETNRQITWTQVEKSIKSHHLILIIELLITHINYF